MPGIVLLKDIVDALEMQIDEASSFLDLDTGQVETVSHDLLNEAEDPGQEEPGNEEPSNFQFATLPLSSFTSTKKWLWGLVHSIFVTVPVRVTGLFESYSAPKEWCATSGIAASNIPKAIRAAVICPPGGDRSSRFPSK
jgi:hypothetical protein